MTSPAEIARAIEAALPGARVRASDTTGAGDHFEVEVVAAQFAGKGLVEQHRLVYGALERLMPAIHALSLRTRPPEENVR
jgi:stress-induced morphogen